MLTLSLFNSILAIGMIPAYSKAKAQKKKMAKLKERLIQMEITSDKRPRDLQGVESGHEVVFSDGVRHQSNSLDENPTARTVPGL